MYIHCNCGGRGITTPSAQNCLLFAAVDNDWAIIFLACHHTMMELVHWNTEGIKPCFRWLSWWIQNISMNIQSLPFFTSKQRDTRYFLNFLYQAHRRRPESYKYACYFLDSGLCIFHSQWCWLLTACSVLLGGFALQRKTPAERMENWLKNEHWKKESSSTK